MVLKGGAKEFDLSFVMKRIPKGWIYRQYGKPFEAIIEGMAVCMQSMLHVVCGTTNNALIF